MRVHGLSVCAAISFSATIVLLACSKQERREGAGIATLTSAQAAATSEPPDEPNPTPAPKREPFAFAERFAAEKASRVPTQVTVENAFERMRKRGVEIRDEKQNIASTFGAKYCVSAFAGKTIGMSVCEYADAATAKKGADQSRKLFASIASRTIAQHGATTLTSLVSDATSPEDTALRAKLVAAFLE